MQKSLIVLIAVLMLSFSNGFSQSESANVPGSEIKSKGAKSWTAQFTHTNIPTSGSYGIETDGTHFYITKWSGDTIWKYTTAGVFVSSFTIPGVSGLRDLAYDGTYFYGGNNGNAIYKMDFTTESLIGTIAVPYGGVTVRNICYDPANDALWVGAWGSDLVLVNQTGLILDTILSSDHGLTSTAGTAYDTVTPGGPFIWAITAGGTPAEIHQVNVNTKQPTGVVHFTEDDVNATAQGIGGGLFIAQDLVPGTFTLGGIIQNNLLFGYDLASVIPDSFDIAMDYLDIPANMVVNDVMEVKGEVKNQGLVDITSYDLGYRIDGGTVFSQSISGVNIQQGQTHSFIHNDTWTPTSSGQYLLEVWANNPNGVPDENTANDTMAITISVFDTIVEKNVLIEQATGTWCGFCTDGAYILRQILASEPNAIGIAIHRNDAMEFTAGNTVHLAYGPSYPNAYIDRVLFPDQSKVGISRGIWDEKVQERLNAIVPMIVEAVNTYDINTKTVTIDLTTTFYDQASGNFRVNAYIVEDSVTGTGSGYDQANSYNNTSGHPYQGAGNPIVGYVHRNVVRDMLGGAWGSPGIIPSSVNKNDVFTKQYTYTVPAGVNPNRLRIVVLVQEYNTDITKRNILNSNIYDLGFVDGIMEKELPGDFLATYPNPANDFINVEFMLMQPCNVSFEVFNMIGEKVSSTETGFLSNGEHHKTIDVSGLPKGIYILKANFNGTVRAQKIVVN